MGLDHVIYAVPIDSELYRDVHAGLPPEKVEMLHSMKFLLENALLPNQPGPLTRSHEVSWLDDMRAVSPSVIHRWTEVDRRFEGVVWLLSRIPSIEVPPESIVYGEAVLGNSSQRLDGIRMNSPELCSEIAKTLAPLEPREVVLEHYDESEREAAPLYKRGGSGDLLANDIHRLRQFYLETAEHGDAAIAAIW